MMQSAAIRLAQEGEGLASVNGDDNLILYLILLTSLVALGFAALFAKEVLAAGQGTPKMIEIAKAVQEGAAAYLSRQFRTLAVFAALVFLLLFILPAILAGQPPLLVAIVGSAAIMIVVLFLTHGFTLTIAMAVLGTLESTSRTARAEAPRAGAARCIMNFACR